MSLRAHRAWKASRGREVKEAIKLMQTQKAPRPHRFSVSLYSRKPDIQGTQSPLTLSDISTKCSSQNQKWGQSSSTEKTRLLRVLHRPIFSLRREKNPLERNPPQKNKKPPILSLYGFSKEASYRINPWGWGTGRSYISTYMNWQHGRCSMELNILTHPSLLPDRCWLLILCVAAESRVALPNLTNVW